MCPIKYVKNQPLPELRQELARKDVNDDSAFDLLLQLGRAGDFDAEADVARFLNSNISNLRDTALTVLVFEWNMGKKHERHLWQMAYGDPDPHIRSAAAFCVGSAYERSRDPAILWKLSKIVLNPEEDRFVREGAYLGCLSILGLPLKEWSEDVEPDLDRDPAWQQVMTHIEPS